MLEFDMNNLLQHSCGRFFLSLRGVKLLSLILSIYMLALSLAPCTDGLQHEHQTNSCNNEVLVDHHNHADNNNEHQDTCPPFCVCVCCGSIVVTPSQIYLKENSNEIFLQSLQGYLSIYSFEYNTNVWHPPAIS